LLIRENLPGGGVGFLLYPHEHWRAEGGEPFLTLPAKKTVRDPFAPFIQGSSLDNYIDAIARGEWGLETHDFDLDQEFDAVEFHHESPTQRDALGRPIGTCYTIYPVEIWVHPRQREALRERLGGCWLTCEQAIAERRLSPTARSMIEELRSRRDHNVETPPDSEHAKRRALKADALRSLFSPVPDMPSMDALARAWLSQNLRGVRYLPRETLSEILDAGDRAFNLRVADPYLRYQMQGQRFTWSFFTHKEKQDCHVHGAPIVEIYGILEGEMEIWSKPYYERGTSAWCHRVVKAGDWLEVDSLQCHIVHWLTEGKGVVFKAGPGPLAEVGKLGVKGKTPCADCPCMKPARVKALEALNR
jgi:hypothetical protein